MTVKTQLSEWIGEWLGWIGTLRSSGDRHRTRSSGVMPRYTEPVLQDEPEEVKPSGGLGTQTLVPSLLEIAYFFEDAALENSASGFSGVRWRSLRSIDPLSTVTSSIEKDSDRDRNFRLDGDRTLDMSAECRVQSRYFPIQSRGLGIVSAIPHRSSSHLRST